MSNGDGTTTITFANEGTADTVTGNLPKFLNDANFPVIDNDYWRTINAIWPDLINERVYIAPARNGMDRYTGRLLQSWPHVEQSMRIIFETPYHERVLRRWVGSFVPMLLGRSIIPRVVTRFFWAIATALDLWEPDYKFARAFFMGNALADWNPPNVGGITPGSLSAADLIRLGQAIFRYEGSWLPRAHLGDSTPSELKSSTLIGRGNNIWDLQSPTATSL